MTDKQRSICLRAVDHYGTDHQKIKALEELGELAAELARDLNEEGPARELWPRVREELADVMIMCEQLRIIYGGAEVDAWIEKKLERLWTEYMRLPRERRPG